MGIRFSKTERAINPSSPDTWLIYQRVFIIACHKSSNKISINKNSLTCIVFIKYKIKNPSGGRRTPKGETAFSKCSKYPPHTRSFSILSLNLGKVIPLEDLPNLMNWNLLGFPPSRKRLSGIKSENPEFNDGNWNLNTRKPYPRYKRISPSWTGEGYSTII